MRKSKVVLYYLSRYRKLCLAIAASSIFVAFLESFSLAIFVPLLNSILGLGTSAMHSGMLVKGINYLIARFPIEDKAVAGAFILLIALFVKGVSRVANEWVIAYSSGHILYDTKKALMNELAHQEYQYFLDSKQGETSYYVLNATVKIGTLIFKTAQVISELLMVLAITVLLLSLNRLATFFCIAMGGIFTLIAGIVSKNISYILGKGKMEAASGQAVTFNEFFNGIKQIAVFGTKDAWLAKFDRHSRLFTRLYVRDYAWLSIPTNLIEVFGISALLVTFLVMKTGFDKNITSALPIVGVFALALLKVLPALGTISRARMEIIGALPDAEAIISILNKKTARTYAAGREFNGLSRIVQFNNVSFAYRDKKPVLNGISLSIGKNKVTAIVGGSGSGKTTIVNLLLSLFVPSSGEILVDGVSLKEYDATTFRKKIGFVSQDSFIFHSSIADNIAFYSGEYTREDIVETAKAAGIHDFILSLKEGYETIVGERGMKISGGQQQKLAIARALIRKPEILILDEATSALDNKSEEEIHRSILDLAHRYTIVIIAHRLSTIREADVIYVLKDGRIIETGKHEGLIARSGYYKDLYSRQV